MKERKVAIEIENRFRALMDKTVTDPKLKKEVFTTISTLESIASIVDLFTVKFISSEVQFISDIIPGSDQYEETPSK